MMRGLLVLALVIAGSVSLVPSARGRDAISNRLPLLYDDIMGQIAQRSSSDEVVVLTVSEGATVATLLDQLLLAKIFHAVACSLQVGAVLPVRLRVGDSQGSVLSSELGPDSLYGCDAPASILKIAQGFSVLSSSGTELPTLAGVPVTVLQAQDRAASVFSFFTGCTTYAVQIEVSTASATAFVADLCAMDMYLASDIVTDAALWRDRIREDAQAIASAILSVLGPDASVTVSQFVDVLGLIYRGSSLSDLAAVWSEQYVHPLLQAP